jgi:uncharacterized protein (DUF4213/DUF364 family)
VSISNQLLADLPRGADVVDVRIGAFWTAVVVRQHGCLSCGLASALRGDDHHQDGHFPVRDAGALHERDAIELAGLLRSGSLLEASIGMATVNALLEVDETSCLEINAAHVIAVRGQGKTVAVVGHFPFVARLQDAVGRLWVLEQSPGPGDLPAAAASEIIPQADVVAITSTTLINNTFDELMDLCRPDAFVLLLGPSTPLSPLLFAHGVQILSGTRVDDIDTVVRLVGQGATFQQIHRHGVRLVTMAKSGVDNRIRFR